MSEGPSTDTLQDVGIRGESWKAFITNIATLFRNRFLVQNLVRREIRGRYRNAMLGYAWTVLEPAFTG